MTCTHVHIGGSCVTVCSTGFDLLHLPGKVKPKWCPRCRMWLLHRLELRGDRMPSYYEPVATWRCRRCRGWDKKVQPLVTVGGSE